MGLTLLSAQPEASNSVLWVFLGSKWGLLWAWLILVNLAAFAAFGWDKFKAKLAEKRPEARRVPEKNLFLTAALGGGLGALLAMQLFRHKTQHRAFRIGIPMLVLLWAVLLCVLWYLSRTGA